MVTILLIDDEADLLEICQAVIGFTFPDAKFILAPNGNEAVKIIKSELGPTIDLIISDYNMNQGNGAVVFNESRNHLNVPFCLLTGGYLEDYKDLGGFDPVNYPLCFHLMKPIEEKDLIETITKMMKAKIKLV